MVDSNRREIAFRAAGIFWAIFLLDQYSKYLAITYLSPGQPRPVLGELFRLTLIKNPGLAFGLPAWEPWLLSLTAMLLTAVLFYRLFKLRPHRAYRYAAAAILAAAAGNLTDRFWHGKVIDFIDIDFPNLPSALPGNSAISAAIIQLERLPVFNLADFFAAAGLMLVLAVAIKETLLPLERHDRHP